MKPLSSVIYIFLIILLFTSCSSKDHNILIDNKNYIIEQVGSENNPQYSYFIFNNNKKIVENGTVSHKPPDIKLVGKTTLELRFHSGTDADLCRYFDVATGKKSQDFWNVRAIKNNLAIYAVLKNDKFKLVICNVFDKTEYYKTFDRDFSPIATSPIKTAKFISDNQIEVTYFIGKNYKVITEKINLY